MKTAIFNICLKFLSRNQEVEGPVIEAIEKA
jgi:hypothetical protein